METNWDVIIVGGGAAGMSAAQYAARANLNVLLIEEMALGGQGLTIERLENYPGLPEPVDGFQFSQNMEKQAREFGAEILNTSVRSLTKEGNIFKINTGKGEFTATAVIMATGAKHRNLGVPGEDTLAGRGISYCATCDGPFFRGKKMLVVGGGDAACDEAGFLAKLTDEVVMIHRKDRFRAQPAVAQRVLENEKIDVRFDTVAEEIMGEDKVSKVRLKNVKTNETVTEDFAAVFIFVGSIPQTALVPDVEKDEAGYIKTDEKMMTSLPGMFAAGDVRNTPFRQVITSASDGAVAAHWSAHYIDSLKGQAYV
ncbi:MAG: thioredoxin-disulfide reductase [Spirochaetales bacterium]|nr:thioredoxin-disulfide reductase [Spirochaetales bacterium]